MIGAVAGFGGVVGKAVSWFHGLTALDTQAKLAVWPERQGQGTGHRLMQAAEDLARRSGLAALELETRIELTENHTTFAALGFVKTAELAHAGYDRPTYIRMQKRLA